MEGFRLVVAGPDGVRELTDEQFFKLIPRGCRFCPTDEDLIYYIKDKALKKKLPFNRIKDVNIYHCDPEHLIEKFRKYGEKEWYFFTPRDRKYPNGKRPNRKAGDGFWKATGVDKKIYTGNQHIGDKKALVYYEGKPPGKNKTDWIMYEYRLAEGSPCTITGREDMRLDDCVLCRIHKKPKSNNRQGQNANKDSTKISVEDTSLVNDSDHAKVASDEDGTLSNDSGLPTSEFDEEYENDAGSSTLEDTRTVNDPSSLGKMNHCNGMNYHGFDNSQNNSGNNHGFDNSQNNSCNNHGLDHSLQYSLCPFPSQTDYMATSNVVNVQNPTYLVTPDSIKPLMSLQHNNQQFTHANGFGSVSSEPPSTENNQQSKFELTYLSYIDELVGPDWLQDFDFDAFNDLPGPTADVTGPQDDVSQPSLKEPTPQDDISQPPLNEPKLRDDGSQPPLNKRPRYK